MIGKDFTHKKVGDSELFKFTIHYFCDYFFCRSCLDGEKHVMNFPKA